MKLRGFFDHDHRNPHGHNARNTPVRLFTAYPHVAALQGPNNTLEPTGFSGALHRGRYCAGGSA
jgi:hypothetical protein